MCNPLALTAGVSIAQAGMNIMGQQQGQKAQIEYEQAQGKARNDQIIQNRSMATTAYIQQMQSENVMKAQETQSNAEKGHDLDIQRLQAQGTAKAAAADAGVGGASLDNLLMDFNRQESMMLGRLDLNQQFSDQARDQREIGYGNTFKQRVQMIQPYQPNKIASMDYLSPLLAISKTGLDIYNKRPPAPKVADARGSAELAPKGQFPVANSDFFS